ncbi:MAG: hypothetical protein KA941_08715 [Flavobacteriales bacterium]|nr:hypothetical protein [Flavobacteriales bacterium]
MRFDPRNGRIATFLLIVFLWGQYGCVFWHRHDRPTSSLPKLTEKRTRIYLITHNSVRSSIWKVEHPVLTNDSLNGKLVLLPDAIAGRILEAESGREARVERNKVLLHLDGTVVLGDTTTTWTGLALSHVTRIEAFDVDAGITIGVTILTVAACFGFVMLLVYLLKTSCPFVYSHAPDGVHFEGEIFSGAIYPQLERHDRLPLQYIAPVNGEYRITLANKAKEIQSTDLLKLVTVDHGPGITTLFDKYGAIHAFRDPQAPLAAKDLNGTNVRERLLLQDEFAWMGDPLNEREEANDGMELTFSKPPGSKTGKLMITARNTFWVDNLYMLLLDEQGTLAPEIDRKNTELRADELRTWSRAQRMPLAVWMEARPGEWERVDQFELAGPMAWRSDVLELDLSKVAGDAVHLRFDCGFLFWEVDQVAMDFSADDGLIVRELDATSALDRNGADVLQLLSEDDDRNYVQPAVDDAAEIVFPFHEPASGLERSVFLHGAGHYRILHETVPIEPDLLYLRSFKKADAFPKYSRERWQEFQRTQVAIPL